MRLLHLPLPLSLLLLAACASTPVPPPAPALPSRSAQPLPDLVAQTSRFASQQHSERLQALTALLDGFGLEYRLLEFANPHPERDPRTTGHNVELVFGDGDREIIVGAHYDAVKLPDGRYADGMVDNAAGSVVLAHVARALYSQPLRHRVRVLFFDLEEIGLLGSAHYAATLDETKIAAMVNLDVQGYGDTVLFGPSAHTGNETVYAAMHRVCAAQRFDCLQFPAYPPSDDRSFQQAGIPNISIAVMRAAESHQMWLMLNGGEESGMREGFLPPVFTTIHSANDTADKLDPAGMTLGHDAVLSLVMELDRALD